MMMDDREPRTLKTVETTCSVLNALKETGGATVTDLSNRLELSKGAVYNHLVTLRREGFVRKVDGRYDISFRFHNFGVAVKHRSLLYTAGRSEAERLAAETGESVNLMVEEFGKGIYLFKEYGREGIAGEFHDTLLEETDFLHWSGSGKAILAQFDEERVRRIADEHGLPAATDRTITGVSALLDDLADVRDRGGVARNDEEQVRGIRAVGAPVTNGEGDVLGSVSISGPTSRITDEKFYETYPTIVSRSANIIEVSIETREADGNPV